MNPTLKLFSTLTLPISRTALIGKYPYVPVKTEKPRVRGVVEAVSEVF